jgi:hypothetical protein
MIFAADDTLFEFLLHWGCHVVPVLQLLLGFGFIMVDTGFILYDILLQEALTPGSVVVQKISGHCLPCVSMRSHQHS